MRKSIRTNSDKQTCIWIDKTTHRKLKIISAIQNKKVAELLREIVGKYKYKKTVKL